MNIAKSLTSTTLLSGVMLLTACTTFATPAANPNADKQTATNTVQFQQIRNATIKLDYDGIGRRLFYRVRIGRWTGKGGTCG